MNKESQVQTHSQVVYPTVAADDEIDLKELFLAIWQGKWLIIIITTLFAVGGVLYALSQANTYKAEVLLAPAEAEGGGGLGGQLGGLASLAGVNIGGGEGGVKVEALAVLQSRKFINTFITKHDLLVELIASKKWLEATKAWDSDTQSWNESPAKHIIDSELFNIENNDWEVDKESRLSLKPTLWEANKAFKQLITVSEDRENGMVTIGITHHSPVIAQKWTDLLVVEINAWMKNKKLTETDKNIGYLKEKLEQTAIAEVRMVFFQMIEEQLKNKMLAEVQDEFVFKVIDPAVIPEEKAGPKRALICVLATMLGGILSVLIVLIRHFFKKPEEES
jgi:uncharacterized protein involved in exopolysaccharide biosynthesis